MLSQLKHGLADEYVLALQRTTLTNMREENLFLRELLLADSEILGVECDLALARRCNFALFCVVSVQMSDSKLK